MNEIHVYTTKRIDEMTHPEEIEDILNEHAAEGWRLHSMVRVTRGELGNKTSGYRPSSFDLLLTFEGKVDR